MRGDKGYKDATPTAFPGNLRYIAGSLAQCTTLGGWFLLPSRGCFPRRPFSIDLKFQRSRAFAPQQRHPNTLGLGCKWQIQIFVYKSILMQTEAIQGKVKQLSSTCGFLLRCLRYLL
jgi:hypothetical protein